MLLWILYDTDFGNGRKLAEMLKDGFIKASSNEWEIKLGDVKEVEPTLIVNNAPDVLILGGAIRMFQGAPKSKKWLKQLNNQLITENIQIKYGAAYLTHGLPTDKIKGWAKRYLAKLQKASNITYKYPIIFTGKVKETEGPLVDDVPQKSTIYVNEILQWMKTFEE